MKVTKYPQSCVLVETRGMKILVDPGVIDYEYEFLAEWVKADAILVTHKHPDHIHCKALKEMDKKVYTTMEVSMAYEDLKVDVIKEGDIIQVGEVKVEVVKAVHGFIPPMKGGGEVNENVGFIIDDGDERFYITSDTISFNNAYRADVVALPVTGHGLTLASYEAALMAVDIGARLVLVTHLDNPEYPTDMDNMHKMFSEFNINYIIMETGQSIDLSEN